MLAKVFQSTPLLTISTNEDTINRQTNKFNVMFFIKFNPMSYVDSDPEEGELVVRDLEGPTYSYLHAVLHV